MRRKDILKVSKNTAGRDLIIGDVHGSASALEAVLNGMGPNDRLFVVGDLLDRGEDSARVIQLIREKNAGKDPAVVYVVKGNHEELFLDAIKFLNDTTSSYDLKPGTQRHALLNFLQNGGDWIYNDDTVRQTIRDHVEQRRFTALLKYLEDKAGFLRSDLADIQALIDPLPYVILAGETADPDAFVICHADRPPTLTDEKLNERIAADGMLTPSEKEYSAWARLTPTRDKQPVIADRREGRSETSTITYCGHNAMIDEETTKKAIRKDTNTINLDFATFYTNVLVVVDHTNKKAMVIPAASKMAETFLITATTAITAHLELSAKTRTAYQSMLLYSRATSLYLSPAAYLLGLRRSKAASESCRFFRSEYDLRTLYALSKSSDAPQTDVVRTGDETATSLQT